MIRKILPHVIVIITFFGLSMLIIGFFVGRRNANKINTKVTKTQSSQVVTQNAQVQTHVTNQKDSTTSQRIVYVEKFYSSKGKLLRDISETKTIGVNILESTQTRSQTQVKTQDVNTSQSIMTVTIQPNYGIGFSIPAKFEKPQEGSLIGMYRTFENLYAFGEGTVDFKTINLNGQVGFIYLF